MDDYIKISDLKDLALYERHARNGNYGIWIAENRGFFLSRHKFGDNFMFMEFHWDCPAWATAKPIRLIEQSPFEKSDFEYVEKVNSKGEKYHDWKSHHEVVAYLNKFEGTLEERTAQNRR
jgi:hypothetical protein